MIKSQSTNDRIAWRQTLKYDKKHGHYDASLKDFPMQLIRQLQKNRQKTKHRLLWRLYEQGGHDGR
jgi:hypothetical protein